MSFHLFKMSRIVIVGHIDSGKTTCAGHLLYQLGVFSSDDMRMAERKSVELKMESWKFAYLLDVNEEEQISGKTRDYIEIPFHTCSKDWILVDTPGHTSMIRKMIQGSESAQIGIWVISCRRGEFEKSISDIQHLAIIKCVGITNLIVVLNKWDITTISLTCAQTSVLKVLQKFGLHKSVHWCCTSGWLGLNLTTREPSYPTESLTDILSSIQCSPMVDTSFTSSTICLDGLVVGPKLITAGYTSILHGGKKELEIEVKHVQTETSKPFAKSGERCKLTIDLSLPISFSSNRFILRDGNETIFLGVNKIE